MPLPSSSELSKSFVEDVLFLVSTGRAKNYSQITETLGWNVNSMSAALNGKRQTPVHIIYRFYRLFFNELLIKHTNKKTEAAKVVKYLEEVLNEGIKLTLWLYDEKTARAIHNIFINSEPNRRYEISETFEQIVRFIDSFQYDKAGQPIQDLRDRFYATMKYAGLAVSTADHIDRVAEKLEREKKLMENSGTESPEMKLKLGKQQNQVETLLRENYNRIRDLGTLLNTEVDVNDISFMYVLEKFVENPINSVALKFLKDSKGTKKTTTHFFQGEMPGEIEELHRFYPIPLFASLNAQDLQIISTEGIKQVRTNSPYKLLIIPDLTDSDFAFAAFGTIMTAKIKHGDIVVCKTVPRDESWSNYRHGQTYVAYCDDPVNPVVISTIQEGKQEGTFQLISDRTPEFYSYPIDKARTIGLWIIKAVISKAPI